MRMRVLFILPFVPIQPNSGNKHLTTNLLLYITHVCSVDIVALCEANENIKDVKEQVKLRYPSLKNIWIFKKPFGVQRYSYRIAQLVKGIHPAMGNYWNKSLAQLISDVTTKSEYDIVHFDMIHMSQYHHYCKVKNTILIGSDAYSLSAKIAKSEENSLLHKFRLTVESWLLRRVETHYYKNFKLVLAVSNIDASYLNNLLDSKNVKHIGIPLGREFTINTPRVFDNGDKNKSSILIVGNVSNRSIAYACLSFLKYSLPNIRRVYPEINVVLLGKNPDRRLIGYLESVPSLLIDHIEYVDEYIRFLQNDWVYVYPQSCGTGLQTKVQQAMSVGLPVVGYPIAFNALGIENWENICVCNKQEDFEKYILSLLSDYDLRRKIGLFGSMHVRKHFDLDVVGKELLNMYCE